MYMKSFLCCFTLAVLLIHTSCVLWNKGKNRTISNPNSEFYDGLDFSDEDVDPDGDDDEWMNKDGNKKKDDEAPAAKNGDNSNSKFNDWTFPRRSQTTVLNKENARKKFATKVPAVVLPPSNKSHPLSSLCNETSCLHGGTCMKKKNQASRCLCTDYRDGPNCNTLCRYPKWGKSCKAECTGCTSKVCNLEKGCLVCDKPGFTGVPKCDQVDCLDIPCENFGYCHETIVSFSPYRVSLSCRCDSYHTGKRCEINVAEQKYQLKCEEKDAKLCKNGATCRKGDWSEAKEDPYEFICVCRRGFYGKYCDESCFSPHEADCDNGDCITLPSKALALSLIRVTCVCWPGYTGRTCNQKCRNTWGKDCENNCGKCDKGKPCHEVHGLCPKNLCAPGFFGIRCDKQRGGILSRLLSIAQNLAFDINVGLISSTKFNATRSSSRELPEEMIQNLQVFIAVSFEKHNRTVMDISEVIISESGEILSATGAEGRPISKVIQRSVRAKHVAVSGTIAKRKTLISERDINTENFNQYKLNYTVTFAGKAKDITGRQLKSILRKEAKNFKYSAAGISASIDPKSIKMGIKRLKRNLAENEKSTNHKTLFMVVSLVIGALIIVVAVTMLLKRALRVKLTPKQRGPAGDIRYRYPNHPSQKSSSFAYGGRRLVSQNKLSNHSRFLGSSRV